MTTKQLAAIKGYLEQGDCVNSAAKKAGVRPGTVYAHFRRNGMELPNRYHNTVKQMSIYAVYDKRDDSLLACGTAEECAERLGIGIPSFYAFVSRSGERKRRSVYKVGKEAWT